MTAPPPYPRIPHLMSGRGTRDDRVLNLHELDALLAHDVLVEEKLDGANVVIWLEDGRVECALRSGLGGQDRGRQLGPLRAWLAGRSESFRELLGERALYAEWLLVAHGTRYDALTSYLVGLDLWSPTSGFSAPDVRDQRFLRAGIAGPPELYRGAIDSVNRLESLLGVSRAGSEPMEGIIIRALEGQEPRIAKLLHPDFAPVTDVDWRRGRPHNLLRERELSWQ